MDTLLYYAVKNNCDCAELLINHKDIDLYLLSGYFKSDILGMAVVYENIKIVNLLLTKGMDINQPDKYGDTLLHKTVNMMGNVDMARVLLNHGIDSTKKNAHGKTAKMLAIEYGISRFIDLITQYEPVDIN